MNIDLVIFDLDGVLVDACEWHRLALNEALKEVCNYEISLDEHYSTFNGIPTKKKLNILTKTDIIKQKDIQCIYDKKQAKTLEIIRTHCKIRQEKIDMLKYLKANNVKIACYTNSIRQTGSLMLKKTGIYDLFDLFLSNQDVPEPKPNPIGYTQVMEYFGISKQNTLIIEDSPKGLSAALDSGARVVKVNNPDDVDVLLFRSAQ
tara:strand:+ start:7393 stop:8004 length:612 start_codon:yes stop_codon:yes gene_type:complete